MLANHIRVAAALFLAIAAPATAADPIPADAAIAPDPAMATGTLPNGLRYAIIPNKLPAGAVSIRLVLDAGSYDEAEDELGYAHFIEHMAFRSTRQAPGGVMDNRFAALGIALGRDHNAETSVGATIYRVDIPAGAAGGVRDVLTWLRDAGDGILFTPAAVDVERGVLLAELRARSGPIADAQLAAGRFQAPHLRSMHRQPGGTPASLAAASPAALQAFHERWYRPENATLVIAGDTDAATATRMVTEIFESWRAKGPRPDRVPAADVFPERATDALTVVAPSLPDTIAACRILPLDVERKPTLERLRRETLSAIWTEILNARLGRLSSRLGSPLMGAGAVSGRDLIDGRATCLTLMPADGRWKEALAGAQAELRRLVEDGPTDTEVGDAILEMRWALEGAQIQAATRQTQALANEIVAAAIAGRAFEAPEDRLGSFDIAMAGVDAADVKEAIRHDWSGGEPSLVATSPAPRDKAELLAAWQANGEAARLEAYSDREPVIWPYGDYGRRGKVARREVIADPGFIRLQFRNGVVVHYKKTDFETAGVELRVLFGHGEQMLAPEMRQPAALAAALLNVGGLGKLDYDEINEALQTFDWTFTTSPQTDAWVMSSTTGQGYLGQQLDVMTAFLTDPGFRPLIDEKIPTAVDMAYRAHRTDPATVALDALEQALFPKQKSFPPREQVLRYRAADYARLLKPIMATAPIEIAIVGDVDEKTVRRAVGATLGALPARTPLPPPGESPFRRFPEVLPPSVTGYHEGPADKAALMLLWPLYVATPDRRSEEYAIHLLSAVFQNRLLQRVRMQMGKVYSLSVSTPMPDAGDQGHLAAAVEAAPADLDRLAEAIREIAGELVAGRISEREVADARQPLVAARRQAAGTNQAWAAILAGTHREPRAVHELVRYQAQMEAITADDVRRAAATWLARAPIAARALPAPAAARAPTAVP